MNALALEFEIPFLDMLGHQIHGIEFRSVFCQDFNFFSFQFHSFKKKKKKTVFCLFVFLRTDKWAETEIGTKWGDKWEEKFFGGVGSRQGETWHVTPAGERMSHPIPSIYS